MKTFGGKTVVAIFGSCQGNKTATGAVQMWIHLLLKPFLYVVKTQVKQ
jgi:hypothetical protein